MACNLCETGFQQYQSLVVSVATSGSSAFLYLSNQGRNILLLRRILLSYSMPGGGGVTLYLRAPPDAISWSYPSTYLETGITALYYKLNNLSAGTLVQAQAEYTEMEDRSRSCPVTI
jgi:hypothetical protein